MSAINEAHNYDTAESQLMRGPQITSRELFCHYLARAYEAGHRDTSYVEGETLDAVLREINQVLGAAGYEPESPERAALLAKKFPWGIPEPAPRDSIERRALEFVHDFENWEDYEECKGSDSLSLPPEWFLLCEAVEAKYGAPVLVEDIPGAPVSPFD